MDNSQRNPELEMDFACFPGANTGGDNSLCNPYGSSPVVGTWAVKSGHWNRQWPLFLTVFAALADLDIIALLVFSLPQELSASPCAKGAGALASARLVPQSFAAILFGHLNPPPE
jgi:hypothetical protein